MEEKNYNDPEENSSKKKEEEDDDDFGMPEVEFEPIEDEDDDSQDDSVKRTQEDAINASTDANEAEVGSQDKMSFQEDDHDATDDSYDNQDAENVEDPLSSPVVPPKYTYDEEDKKSNLGPILAGIFILLILVGVSSYFFVFRDAAEPEPVAQEAPAPEPEPEPEPMLEEAPQVVTEKAEGTITTLSNRTGKSYVVISSFLDGDLAMDFSKQMSDQGVDVTIIPPFGRHKFHRVAVEEHDNFQASMDRAEELKATYGEQTWAIRY
ncbi:MAG: hypothetical protein LAT68_05010 [Cyclobacteriaceae bacterium]|nr:hypothetical protein [Cyclobacteriaceae bacterium]MCH8515670.1 hypothetical protein [Cyclobacteriaceae bacterium]